METTLENYIKNPGIIKGMATNSQIKLILKDYQNRFDTTLVREAGQFAYFLYKDQKKKDVWYIHMLVPSEATEQLYYDVVLEFTINTEKLRNDLFKEKVRFFSNDPAFMFTWAYAFNEKGLLIDWLKPKLSKKSLTQKPVIRNPNIQTGYVKTFYFAYFYMKLRLLNQENKWLNAIPLNKQKFLKNVMHSGEKLDSISRIKEVNKKKKEQEQQFKNPPDTTDRSRYTSSRMKLANTVSYAKPASRASLVKKATIARNIGYKRRKR